MSDILKRVGHGTLIACGIGDNGVFITMGAFHHLGSFRSIAFEQNGVIDTVAGNSEIGVQPVAEVVVAEDELQVARRDGLRRQRKWQLR